MTPQRLIGVSVALVLALAALAFWPAPAWTPPARPSLRAPIVFDELVSQPPPPSDPALLRDAAAQGQ